MNELRLPVSQVTPRVELPAGSGVAWIEGACYPENPFSYFESIFHWMNDFRQQDARKLELNVKLDYFNTSSSKCLLDLFQLLHEASREGAEINVRWHYLEGDPDIRDAGAEFAEDAGIPFDLVPY